MVAISTILFQTLTLLSFIAWHVFVIVVTLPFAVCSNLLCGSYAAGCNKTGEKTGGTRGDKTRDSSKSAFFVEGTVSHARVAPIKHAFRYFVRAAMVNLDSPPSWFDPRDHMTADSARAMTDGKDYVAKRSKPEQKRNEELMVECPFVWRKAQQWPRYPAYDSD
eukprot:gene21437-28403_t